MHKWRNRKSFRFSLSLSPPLSLSSSHLHLNCVFLFAANSTTCVGSWLCKKRQKKRHKQKQILYSTLLICSIWNHFRIFFSFFRFFFFYIKCVRVRMTAFLSKLFPKVQKLFLLLLRLKLLQPNTNTVVSHSLMWYVCTHM